MKLTPQEAEILELIGIVDKKIRALPSLSELHSQALNHLHGVVCEIASRPYQRKIANETREAVNTAVVYHPIQHQEKKIGVLWWEVEYFNVHKGKNMTMLPCLVWDSFGQEIDAGTAVSIANMVIMLSWGMVLPIMGIRKQNHFA